VTASQATLTITGKTSIDHPGETTQLMAVLASRSCATPRVYQVDIEEWQGRLIVFAQGQQFVSFAGPPGFTGTRTANTVTFTISDNIFEQLCFVDGLLGYSGLATGTITERGIVATFDGRIGTCQAADHRMELVRVQTAR
jgi:hypothetical protein